MVRHLFEVEDGFVDGVHFRLFGGDSEAFATAGVLERLDVAEIGMIIVLKEGIREVTPGLGVGDAGEFIDVGADGAGAVVGYDLRMTGQNIIAGAGFTVERFHCVKLTVRKT